MTLVLPAPAELDAASADAFARELERSGLFVVDCSAIEFIDSSGLQALLKARQRAIASGDLLVLRHPPAVLLRLLRVTSTDELFAIEP